MRHEDGTEGLSEYGMRRRHPSAWRANHHEASLSVAGELQELVTGSTCRHDNVNLTPLARFGRNGRHQRVTRLREGVCAMIGDRAGLGQASACADRAN